MKLIEEKGHRDLDNAWGKLPQKMLRNTSNYWLRKMHREKSMDHVIVSEKDYYSFAENGLLKTSEKQYLTGLRDLRDMTADEFNTKYSFTENDDFKWTENMYSL